MMLRISWVGLRRSDAAQCSSGSRQDGGNRNLTSKVSLAMPRYGLGLVVPQRTDACRNGTRDFQEGAAKNLGAALVCVPRWDKRFAAR